MQLELDQQERTLLLQLVDAALHEIGTEIRRTRTYDYKDDLKERRRLLQRLRGRLADEVVSGIREEDEDKKGGM